MKRVLPVLLEITCWNSFIISIDYQAGKRKVKTMLRNCLRGIDSESIQVFKIPAGSY